MDDPPPLFTEGVAGLLAGRLLDLADQVRRLDVPGSRDPSQFARDKTELAGKLAALARGAETRLGPSLHECAINLANGVR